MRRKLVVIMVLLILVPLLVYVAWLYVRFIPEETPPSGGPVCNLNTGLNYTTIQAAIDAKETLDGHTIFVKEGIYREHVVANKSISLIGENRTTTVIDGNGTGTDIRITANSVVVKGFTIRNGTTGIYLHHTNTSLIMENDAVLNGDAILVNFSSSFTVHRNIAGNNTYRGILVSNSQNFTVSNNYVYGNGMYGLNTNSSRNGLIKQNDARGNDFDGIGLVDSDNCTVVGNNAENNRLYGILVDSSGDSLIYHNNVVNNTSYQASDYDLSNRWDDGVEGNYWSNYTGVDSNHDGIGDTAHVINGGNQDNLPLMGMFYGFNTSTGHQVNVISNSTVEDFVFLESSSALRFNASNSSAAQTFGFCRVRIPKALISPPYNITVADSPVTYTNIYENETLSIVYFTYQHSRLEIVIIPDLP